MEKYSTMVKIINGEFVYIIKSHIPKSVQTQPFVMDF